MSEPQNDMERVFGVPTPRPTRQDADGTPFISYFAKETSFIWDGLSTTVQVCDGAAGEPVTDTFEIAASLPNYVSNLTPGVLLARFANACEFYLATRRQ